MLFNNRRPDSGQQYQTRWVWGALRMLPGTAKAISLEENQMIEIITNPILGGMVATFGIGIAFTAWSVIDDWMWQRKNK